MIRRGKYDILLNRGVYHISATALYITLLIYGLMELSSALACKECDSQDLSSGYTCYTTQSGASDEPEIQCGRRNMI